MRFIVYGIGAVGGVMAGRLHEHGHHVVGIARGEHFRATRERGLRVDSPDGTSTIPLQVVDHPREIDFTDDDVVLLAMKTQDTTGALDALSAVAPPDTPVACVQNGVENERLALRRFQRVYGVCVFCPAVHLEPGVVQVYGTPLAGVLDVGRYPAGIDETARSIAAALEASTFGSHAQEDIMRWKYTKLLMNLGNSIEALCGRDERTGEIARLARHEGTACLEAAGIDHVSDDEFNERLGGRFQMRPIAGERRGGGSSWQSLARGAGSIEADYLNGEIVLLGRLHAVPAPVNELLQTLANRAAREGTPPGSLDPSDVLDEMKRGAMS